jgi:murE/murF fusion protein
MTAALLTLLTPAQAVQWLRQQGASALLVDSRQLQPGQAFIAWPGAALDGRQFVEAALAQGAAACLVECQGSAAWLRQWQASLPPEALARVACYEGLKADAGPIAALWQAQPSHQLDVLAVTGTNGKTSTAWWLAQALSQLPAAAGLPCGFVGTLGVGQPPQVQYNGLTTPDPLTLQLAFRQFAEQGLAACAIEASSIGLAEGRLAGSRIKVALYTNFTQDHLDYHGSMAAYWASKAALFDWPGLQAAVLNLDDEKGEQLAHQLARREDLALWTYGLHPQARLQASNIRHEDCGLCFELCERTPAAGPLLSVRTALLGAHNASNLLAVIGGLRALGVPLAQAVQVCARLTPVPGRMTCLGGQRQPLVVIDFAHTPDAVEKVLHALRPMARQRGGQLAIVLGCGGDRDPVKRPLMAAVAERLADSVRITSDNPRSEQPMQIIDQMLAGVNNPSQVAVQPDRARAIADALAQAQPQDVVLIAGKGHEHYQEIAGIKHPFSDFEHAQTALQRRLDAPQAAAAHADGLNLSLAQAADWLRVAGLAVRLHGDPALRVQRLHTDSRTLQEGDLFLALRGERYDGHDFLDRVAASGACAVIAERGVAGCGLSGLEVEDSRRALGLLAAAWRAQFALPLIAVTGSNGKTTVTQMLASVLRAWQGDAALATQGNFNNDIGLPLTLLRLRAHHRAAVVELGMNHPGEIGWLAPLAAPTVALVNNAQREHQEFMVSVEAVARENGSVFQALGAGGVAVYPADDVHAPLWQQLAGAASIRTFGLAQQPDVSAQADWRADHWRVEARVGEQVLAFNLHLAGRHNVRNALAVVACAQAVGVPLAQIARGLAAFRPVQGRSHARVLDWAGQKLTLIDDSYNANPDSVRAAIDVLAELPAPRLLVLGDMGEVGDQGPAFHAEVGRYAIERGIDRLWTLGELSLHSSQAARALRADAPDSAIWHAESIEALQSRLLEAVPGLATLLVKGSRFMGMERLVQAVLAAQSGASAPAAAAQNLTAQEQHGKKN